MADQLGLFDRPAPKRSARAGRSIQQRFEEFHAAHPEVWDLYLRFCYQLLERGRRRYGIGLITERIRWEYAIRPDAGQEFKINNDYRSRYARALVRHEPRFAELFETRELRAD